MKSEELNYLGRFYDELCYAILKTTKKSTRTTSPIVLFIKTQKKRIIEILKEGSLSKYDFKNEGIFESLLEKVFIRPGDKTGEFIITPKGIWEYETKTNKFKLEDFLTFIDNEYFNLFKSHQKAFDVKEKVVIFGMIATRTLSKNSWIDANLDDNVLKYWKEIFDESREKLLELNIIQQTDSENFWKKFKSNQITSPIFYLLRHMNDLPGKTRGLFKFSGKKQYYLELSNNVDNFMEDLKFLINKVLDGKELDIELKRNILAYFNYISSKYSVYLFDFDVHKYSNPEFDELLKDLILFM